MKRILITGENSYIGSMFTKWLSKWPDKYQVDEISVRDDSWKYRDFSSYDLIFHLASIVHQKETTKNVELYYRVNRDLSFNLAKKAKEDGVRHFIFMSTMNVYGVSNGTITQSTTCNPKTAYGDSKFQAENLICRLNDTTFAVSVIRPPMVYGPQTVGNYVKLSKVARNIPVFPKIKNKRSMIYINNLSEFIRLLIEYRKDGIYHPQNKDYVATFSLVEEISKFHNKTIYKTTLFNPLIRILRRVNTIEKIFGDLVYEHCLSTLYDDNGDILEYEVLNFKESVRESEKGI